MATWAEMPRSPGHYAPRMGAPSLPPGRYFRMYMIGYFEGIDGERGIAWRCADSFSLRDFLRLSNRDKVPDHSWLSRTRSRLPYEAHERVFGFVLKLVAERGLVKGERIGVDSSTMEANAALRTIVRRDNGESYRQMLTRMAHDSGIETPSAEDLARFDRKRKGKTLSNSVWKSASDPEAKIAKMKDGLRIWPTSRSTRSISTRASSWPRRSIRPTRETRRRSLPRSRPPRAISARLDWRRSRRSPASWSPTRAIIRASG